VSKDAEGPDLSARLRAGDDAAWEEFVRRIYPSLAAYARRRLPSEEDARDAVGEALVRAVSSIEHADGRALRSPAAWVFAILRHVVLDAQRKRYRSAGAEAPRAAEDPAAVVERAEEHARIRAAFLRLAPADRELLELRVGAGLEAAAVATILGRRPGAVRMAQARALRRLRKLYGEQP
jgi:RNA polymerase sigma-70 factor (ECF subfamily)